MRLFLTSGGLTNDTLKRSFRSLLAKDLATASIAFIPTGANVFSDTSWLETDLANLRTSGVGKIDLVDLSKLPGAEAIRRCAQADAIWVNGGNTYYLLDWVRRSGMAAALPNLLTDRLYVGVSAGSMLVGPSIESNTPIFPEEDNHKSDDLKGLGLVPFAVIPHLFSPSFPNSSPSHIEKFAATVRYPVYALDDASAIEVVAGRVRIVSVGKTFTYNCN